MPLFTLTINNLAPALDKKFQEVERIAQFAGVALQDIVKAGGVQTSGSVYDTGNVYGAEGPHLVGTWAYTPQASS